MIMILMRQQYTIMATIIPITTTLSRLSVLVYEAASSD